jgi:predicted transposase YdaD
MPKPFDATCKGLLEESPPDWPSLIGRPHRRVGMIDADVSTFSGGADKVLRLYGAPDSLLHIDFQAGPDAGLPRRVHVYKALLEDRHDLLVRSVIVLLRPEAELASVNGLYQRQFAGEEPHVQFRYDLIRVWRLSAARLLAGGLGTLPLAPISAVTEAELPAVVERMKERLRGPHQRARARRLWTATYVLMGLRYPRELTDKLLQGVVDMEESVTYQAIIEKGVAKGEAIGLTKGSLQEAKRFLLLLGRDRFGEPDPQVLAALEAITDVQRLEQLGVRLSKVASWHDLLELPPSGQTRRRRKPTS